MLIGIDGNEANVQNRVGIGEYAFELLKRFSNSTPIKSGSKIVIYLKDIPRKDLPKESGNWNYRVIGPKKFWTQLGLPFDLYTHTPRPDVFFSPTHYAPRFSPIPTVVSIMDLSYLHYPQMFRKADLYQLTQWTSYSVKNASKVITISKSSKNDIIQYYGETESKIAVIYPGVKTKNQKSKNRNIMQNSKILKGKYGVEEKFILFVGTLQPRKNIVRLIEAFARVIRGPASGFPPASARSSLTSSNELRAVGSPSTRVTPRLHLVIIGKKGWLYEDILKAPARFGIEERVRFLDFVPDEDLPRFYKNAICFVLPSLYEGFGLPILEAMKYGCPVLASNVSSLPEAGGDAALYFDPNNTDDISRNLEFIIQNSKLRSTLTEKGYQHIKKFSWEKAARETLNVLEEVGR